MTYDRSPGEPPSAAIVSAVAAATNAEPVAMRPLYEAIDPDALDTVCGGDGDRRDWRGAVSFRYEDCDVTVYGDGLIAVTAAEDAG